MTVKELIQSQPEETVVAALCERFQVRAEDREQAEEALTRFVRSLDPIEPVGEGDLILGILRTSEEGEFLEPCLYRKAEIAASFTSNRSWRNFPAWRGFPRRKSSAWRTSIRSRIPMPLNMHPGTRSSAARYTSPMPGRWGKRHCAPQSCGK